MTTKKLRFVLIHFFLFDSIGEFVKNDELNSLGCIRVEVQLLRCESDDYLCLLLFVYLSYVGYNDSYC